MIPGCSKVQPKDDICVVGQKTKKPIQFKQKTVYNLYNRNQKFYSENKNWKLSTYSKHRN